MALRDLCNVYKQYNQYGLRSLTARVIEEVITPSRVVSRSTSRSSAGALAVRTILRVLNDSNIAIKKINILYHSLACSVPCCMIKGLLKPIQPFTKRSVLRCLSLSLSHHAKYAVEAGLDDTNDNAVDFAVREYAEAGTEIAGVKSSKAKRMAKIGAGSKILYTMMVTGDELRSTPTPLADLGCLQVIFIAEPKAKSLPEVGMPCISSQSALTLESEFYSSFMANKPGSALHLPPLHEASDLMLQRRLSRHRDTHMPDQHLISDFCCARWKRKFAYNRNTPRSKDCFASVNLERFAHKTECINFSNTASALTLNLHANL